MSDKKKLSDSAGKRKKHKKHRKKQKRKTRTSEDGESLGSCTEKEWDVADPAYGSELINLKKKPHKVTVFAAPRGKTIERTRIIRSEPTPQETAVEDNADAIGRLCAAIARIYLQDKKPSEIEVEVNLRVKDHSEAIKSAADVNNNDVKKSTNVQN